MCLVLGDPPPFRLFFRTPKGTHPFWGVPAKNDTPRSFSRDDFRLCPRLLLAFSLAAAQSFDQLTPGVLEPALELPQLPKTNSTLNLLRGRMRCWWCSVFFFGGGGGVGGEPLRHCQTARYVVEHCPPSAFAFW